MKIVKLEKPGCNPCQMVQNKLDEAGVEAEKVDVFENPEIAAGYDIASVPATILLDDNGEEVKRSMGYKPNELEEIIKEFKGE